MALVRVASRAELPDGAAKLVEAGGRQIALFNAGGAFYAIDNSCKHRGGPLAEGELDATTVTCPWHGWEFDVTSGANLDDPNVKLGCYPVKIDGDDILIDA
ncbi:MAG TPA: Rieske 2Fe-2S domain-containing protein [Candidatus Binataceae bacterium]|nr:Rieske 2Fe-2S domain-containing protein [Candidatus Binataceae bacterium]